MTEIFKSNNKKGVQISSEIIKNNGIVAFPTETIYGLGANGLEPRAIKKIFSAKGRPIDNPLILHISSKDDLYRLAFINKKAKKLIDSFWPGPLTIVLKKKKIVPKEVSAGLKTVAVRMPKHKLTTNLIKKSGVPIAAPSANISGKPSPTNFKAVYEDMNGKVDAIIDGGESRIGIESTVIDMTKKKPVILRPGGTTKEKIENVIGKVDKHPFLLEKKAIDSPESPGMKYKHYSPKARVILVESKDKLPYLIKRYKNFCLVTFQKNIKGDKKTVYVKNIKELSKSLYSVLRECDRLKIRTVIVESPLETGLGLGVINRLKKAADRVI
ncbi:MAG: L-threonylcarbamoyladenylate synthase [Nanobdellota archaeon]